MRMMNNNSMRWTRQSKYTTVHKDTRWTKQAQKSKRWNGVTHFWAGMHTAYIFCKRPSSVRLDALINVIFVLSDKFNKHNDCCIIVVVLTLRGERKENCPVLHVDDNLTIVMSIMRHTVHF